MKRNERTSKSVAREAGRWLERMANAQEVMIEITDKDQRIWGVMDKRGKVVDVTLSGEIARARASGWNDTYGSARPYTVFRLTGTAEIPA